MPVTVSTQVEQNMLHRHTNLAWQLLPTVARPSTGGLDLHEACSSFCFSRCCYNEEGNVRQTAQPAHPRHQIAQTVCWQTWAPAAA